MHLAWFLFLCNATNKHTKDETLDVCAMIFLSIPVAPIAAAFASAQCR